MSATYTRLSEADREAISRGLAAGLSSAAIALSIGRVTSTVSREVARNYGRLLYRAAPAARKAHKQMGYRRGGKRKLWANGRLRRYVEARLAKAWSPDESRGAFWQIMRTIEACVYRQKRSTNIFMYCLAAN